MSHNGIKARQTRDNVKNHTLKRIPELYNDLYIKLTQVKFTIKFILRPVKFQ